MSENINSNQISEMMKKYMLRQDLKSCFKKLNQYFRIVVIFDYEQIGIEITNFLVSNQYSFDGSYFIQKSRKQINDYFVNVNEILADLKIHLIDNLVLLNPLNIDCQHLGDGEITLKQKEINGVFKQMFPKIYLKTENIKIVFVPNVRFRKNKTLFGKVCNFIIQIFNKQIDGKIVDNETLMKLLALVRYIQYYRIRLEHWD